MGKLTEQQQRRIEDYLEGRLSGENLSRAEKWLAQDPAGQDYLRFLVKMDDKAQNVPRLQPPTDLADKIMKKLTAGPVPSPRFGIWTAPQWALAGLFLGLLVSIGLFYFHGTSQPPLFEVTLSLHAPSARSVEVAGDFTGWKPVPLEKRDGWWRSQVKLTPDRDYQYTFILNGSVFLLDPHQPRAVRDRQGDFYSVLSFTQKGPEMKKTNVTQKSGVPKAVLMACLSLFLPEVTLADTAPVATALSHLQQKTESAGLSASESKALLEKAGKLEQEGLTEATLEALVGESLSLGKGPAAQKALERAGFLVAQGLDAEEAGKVSLKEVQTTRKEQEKSLDQEMAQTLSSGLKEHTATSPRLVLTQKELSEKLEQKREEWEERLENQKRIQAIQNDSLEQHK